MIIGGIMTKLDQLLTDLTKLRGEIGAKQLEERQKATDPDIHFRSMVGIEIPSGDLVFKNFRFSKDSVNDLLRWIEEWYK